MSTPSSPFVPTALQSEYRCSQPIIAHRREPGSASRRVYIRPFARTDRHLPCSLVRISLPFSKSLPTPSPPQRTFRLPRLMLMERAGSLGPGMTSRATRVSSHFLPSPASPLCSLPPPLTCSHLLSSQVVPRWVPQGRRLLEWSRSRFIDCFVSSNRPLRSFRLWRLCCFFYLALHRLRTASAGSPTCPYILLTASHPSSPPQRY